MNWKKICLYINLPRHKFTFLIRQVCFNTETTKKQEKTYLHIYYNKKILKAISYPLPLPRRQTLTLKCLTFFFFFKNFSLHLLLCQKKIYMPDSYCICRIFCSINKRMRESAEKSKKC